MGAAVSKATCGANCQEMAASNCRGSRYSGFMPELGEIFDTHGLLARHLPGYTRRVAQEDMARMVDEALSHRQHLAVEAGTGIGKTFGYLVPALLSGQRTAISTGTLTLQDQLFKRDLPLLGAVVGRPVRVALLKGRSNYLCRQRLETARQGAVRDPVLLDRLESVSHWVRATGHGDLTEMGDFSEDYSLRAWITSTTENCLGSRCPQLDDCFLVEARRRALAADVVVVNHHLLLADLTLKEAGFGQLLPDLDAVIVDEAHQLPEIAQQFFGVSLGSRELQNLARDVVAETRGAPGRRLDTRGRRRAPRVRRPSRPSAMERLSVGSDPVAQGLGGRTGTAGNCPGGNQGHESGIAALLGTEPRWDSQVEGT